MTMTFVNSIRSQFPILERKFNGTPLVYLDNAATTQKPQCVIDSLVNYYTHYNSNVHRGAHHLADEATQKYEGARDIIARFLNANAREEIIWTSGTTESINLVANGLSKLLKAGDEIIVTEMEHHANLIPWQQACLASGAKLIIAPINDDGELILEIFDSLLNDKTKLLALPHVSNALGSINPIKSLCKKAKSVGALVLVDGAQGVAHSEINVQDIGCDFYAFSGHKLFGPTGVGVLWGRQSILEELPVWKTGGEMISEVSYQSAQWNVLPYKFEAGTPNIAGAIGMAEAVRWFSELDQAALKNHEMNILQRATEQVEKFDKLNVIGTAKHKVGIFSFVMEGVHPIDIGFILNQQGLAIRAGHHCAEPLMKRLGITGTARASFSIYNTLDEVDMLFAALRKAEKMLCK